MNDEAASEDIGLQLPLDRPLTPGVRVEWGTIDFVLPSIGSSLEVEPLSQAALLLAVFAAQLGRYSGQSVVPLLVSLLNGMAGGARAASFDTSPGTTVGNLLEQARAQLRQRGDSRAPPGLPAAVALVEDDRPFDSAVAAARDSAPPGLALQLVASTNPQRPRAAFAYNARLLDATTVERLAGHLFTCCRNSRGAPEKASSPAICSTPPRLPRCVPPARVPALPIQMSRFIACSPPARRSDPGRWPCASATRRSTTARSSNAPTAWRAP